MPLGRGEREAVCRAAQAAHEGTKVHWRREQPFRTRAGRLWWFEREGSRHAVQVTTAIDVAYFETLCGEAERLFKAELERLNGNGNGNRKG